MVVRLLLIFTLPCVFLLAAVSANADDLSLAEPIRQNPITQSSVSPNAIFQSTEVADVGLDQLREQLNSQADAIKLLRERLGEYDDVFAKTSSIDDDCASKPDLRRRPVVIEEPFSSTCGEMGTDLDAHLLDFFPTYDRGFVLRSTNQSKLPYELVIPGWIQFRHSGFSRDVDSFTDNAGVTSQIRNRNAFDIERARIYFLGWVHDKRLRFFFHLDGDTDGSHTVDFFDYWWSWDFSDRFRIQVGKRKVTASRQWLLGARRTRLVDRPLANDFFRPDRTVGIFAIGRTGDTGHYELMVGNGFRTSNLPNSQTDNRFTYAATQYFDPFGKFGSQLVDFDNSPDLLMRVGHSFTFSPQSSDTLGDPLPETDFLRLTDGTRINQTGALAPGATVSDFDLYYYGADLAVKHRGWSLNTEVFFRWIEQLRADAPLPHTDLFQRGFYVEGGKFLIPKKLDVNARYSEVQGLFGNSSEYAAGVNWYPLEDSRVKVSFDVTVVDGSPLQNTATNILVGDDGTLFRTQIQAEF